MLKCLVDQIDLDFRAVLPLQGGGGQRHDHEQIVIGKRAVRRGQRFVNMCLIHLAPEQKIFIKLFADGRSNTGQLLRQGIALLHGIGVSGLYNRQLILPLHRAGRDVAVHHHLKQAAYRAVDMIGNIGGQKNAHQHKDDCQWGGHNDRPAHAKAFDLDRPRKAVAP
ncbi:hypothetical protein DSECCO2_664120 [anaerobic digester metagenome]